MKVQSNLAALPEELGPLNPEISATQNLDITPVRNAVRNNFSSLWPAVEVGLAACATLLLEDNANPVAIIYVGPPSSGKTTVATMFDGVLVDGKPLSYRSDKFTPASFVSHSANATKTQLENEISLLPKIKHKIFITPELAPIFNGKQDDLIDRFSIITRVMDGQGLTTDSGTHGQIDCSGDYLFTWLGCTTPFLANVWKVMGNLGSRLFFLLLDFTADTKVQDLVQGMKSPVKTHDALDRCCLEVQKFLENLFYHFGGVRQVQWFTQTDSEFCQENIARCAKLLAHLRTPINSEEGAPLQPESPHRASAVLYNLARGRALVCGRSNLKPEDLPMIIAVTLSSMPRRRREVFMALLHKEGNAVSVKDVEAASKVSRHTAEGYMEELNSLGIGHFKTQGKGKPSYLSIHPDWKWAVSGSFKDLLNQGIAWQKTGSGPVAMATHQEL